MRRIVVGVDGSPSSNRAVEWSLEEARVRGDVVVDLVHAYRSPSAGSAYASSYPYLSAEAVGQLAEQEQESREDREEIARQQAEALIDRVLEEVGGDPDPSMIERVVVAREPTKALLELSNDADLLVMGNRGRGGFKGLLLGSVSQQCVHHARCPVVVIR